ncbi:alpha/beta fold hydrolase [Actinoplanes sp. URMC 104]|uniref:alpha/beta fold hydrolase n=1 Tax=Actinoplanes sp. URMC 104 TaxID=3423409 RepID=UPI003F1D87A6
MPSYNLSPTVVFISQLGTDGDSWQPVINLIRSNVPTFTYDRPGTGTRPPRPEPNPPLP